MTSKLTLVFAALSVVQIVFAHQPAEYSFGGGYSGYEQHHAEAAPSDSDHYEHHYEHHEPSPYSFQYGVNDPHTKDVHSHHEESDGHGNVKGSYSLVEADGSTRIVEYTADHEHGFVAKVHKIEAPQHHHQQEHVYEHESVQSYTPDEHHY